MTKIKICGMTNIDDIKCVNENNVDFAGFVMFFPKSRRNMEPAAVVELMRYLEPSVKSVAVVVSPTLEQLDTIQKRCSFDYIQIHGELSNDVLDAAQIPILRAFNVSNMCEFERWKGCPKIAGFVFDAAEPGSGKVFDWSAVKNIECSDGKIMLVAGGLNPENVAGAVEYLRPYGVDVSSGVENSGGSGKDPDKVREFVRRVRECD